MYLQENIQTYERKHTRKCRRVKILNLLQEIQSSVAHTEKTCLRLTAELEPYLYSVLINLKVNLKTDRLNKGLFGYSR